ncbi:MAG: FAD-dependent oxidoreductase [Candidatus Omnitrophica bacterium]|nr:FAD-dependent oxidoreductase [Candidatus Omnitrophota bacterium]
MANLYDLIIVGAGPAGITAAVYAARKRMKFLVLTGDIGGQAAWSGDIENYTGYQFVTGPDLVSKFEEHMRRYAIDFHENEEVMGISKPIGLVKVNTRKGEYTARAIIIASGKMSRELGVPGEKEFKNKGLTYCATCDGPLFSGKDVAVVGGGNSALDAALGLIRIAKSVYVVNNTVRLGGDAVMREKVEKAPNVKVINEAKVTGIAGDKMVTAIKVRTASGEESIAVQGIFVEIGLIPNSSFAGPVERNERGEIKVNCKNETNIPGIFAAGDVTDVSEKQIIIAAGEGSKAALSAFKYINQSR